MTQTLTEDKFFNRSEKTTGAIGISVELHFPVGFQGVIVVQPKNK